MRLRFILALSLTFFCGSLWAQTLPDCEQKKISFSATLKMASASADGKKALFKQVHSLLLEDWSEASGEVLTLQLASEATHDISFVEVAYFDKNKKSLNKAEFPVVNKIVEKLIWKNLVGANETRQGNLQFKVLDKNKKAICLKNVSIHYADQLDR